ncbi:MAG: hypothetical protein AB1649_10545 [Chloroflexota bacterium]
MTNKTWIEKLSYPSGFMKWIYKSPVLFYRLGLGFIVGRLFMVIPVCGIMSTLLLS